MAVRTEAEVVAARAAGERIRHDRLTRLERVLLRALWVAGVDWSGEGVEPVVGDLKRAKELSDEDAALLADLLEQEEADRYA